MSPVAGITWNAASGAQATAPSLSSLSPLFSPRHHFLKSSCCPGNGTEWAVTNESPPLILAESEHTTHTPALAALAS